MSDVSDRVTVHFYLPADGPTATPRFSYVLSEDTPRHEGRIRVNIVSTKNLGPQQSYPKPAFTMVTDDLAVAFASTLAVLRDHHTAYRMDHGEIPGGPSE